MLVLTGPPEPSNGGHQCLVTSVSYNSLIFSPLQCSPGSPPPPSPHVFPQSLTMCRCGPQAGPGLQMRLMGPGGQLPCMPLSYPASCQPWCRDDLRASRRQCFGHVHRYLRQWAWVWLGQIQTLNPDYLPSIVATGWFRHSSRTAPIEPQVALKASELPSPPGLSIPEGQCAICPVT